MRQLTTARNVLESDVPGDHNASIESEEITFTSFTNDTSWTGVSLTDFGGLPAVEPGEELGITATIVNEGGTPELLNAPNSCTDGLPEGANGTTLRLVAVLTGGSRAESEVCIQDNPVIGGPFSEAATVAFTAPDQPDVNWDVKVFVELGDGTRVTPVYQIVMETINAADGETSDTETDPDGSVDDAEDTFDPDDESFVFDLDDVDISCDVSDRTITEDESAVLDVSIEGFLPPGATDDGSVEVPVRFRADGRTIGTGTGYVTANGGVGADLKLAGLATGTHDLSIVVGESTTIDCGQITVEPVFKQRRVSVSCAVSDDVIVEGDQFAIIVSAANDNALGAEVAFDVLIGGQRLTTETRTLTVSPNDTAEQEVPVSGINATNGTETEYEIEIDDAISQR